MRFRFRTRHLTLLVTLLALAFSIGALRIQQYKTKVALVEHLQYLCSKQSVTSFVLTFDQGGLSHAYGPSEYKPQQLTWFDYLTGDFSALDVSAVALSYPLDDEVGGSVNDVLEYLKHFPTTREIQLDEIALSAEEIARLVDSCPKLQYLDARGSHFTDASLAAISKLTQIERLELSDTNVTGARFGEIADSCHRLRRLNLSGSKFTDQGLAQIARIASLEELDISNTAVNPSALKVLTPAKLPRLKELWLRGVQENGTIDEIPDFVDAIYELESQLPELQVSY